MQFPVEREHFRIVFPLKARPRLLEEDGREHVVLDCSERGVLYVAGAGELPEVGARIAGTVRFSRGAQVGVAGHVVRVHDRTVAVHLDLMGIPMARMMDEQRFIRNQFPMHR